MQGTEGLIVGTGTPAIAFAGELENIGPSQELWFAHDGYLFEITTYPDHAEWLRQIVGTIRFP